MGMDEFTLMTLDGSGGATLQTQKTNLYYYSCLFQ